MGKTHSGDVVLTDAEIRALLRMGFDSPAARTTSELLGLSPTCSDALLRSGFSSLLARGLVRVIDDRFETSGPASAIARALLNPGSWLSFVIRTPGFVVVGLALVRGERVIALTMAPLGTVDVVATATPPSTLGGELLTRCLDRLGPADDVDATITWRDLTHERTVNLRRSAGSWTAAAAYGEPLRIVEVASFEDVIHLVNAAVLGSSEGSSA